MRYAIGCSMRSASCKNKGAIYKGFYAIQWRSVFNHKTMLVNENTNRLIDYALPVFYSVEDAQRFLDEKWKAAKPYFKKLCKENNWSMEDFSFYLVKVDSSRFPFKLKAIDSSNEKPERYYMFNK